MFSRRKFLQASVATAVAGVGVGLAGCTSDSGPVPPTVLPTADTQTPTATPSTDSALRDQVAQSEVDLLAAYAAAMASHPSLIAELTPLAAAHRAHLDAVIAQAPPQISPLPLEKSVAQTRRWLAGLEAAAADQRAWAAQSAGSRELIRTLALVAASEAQHEQVLKTLNQATVSPSGSPS